MSYVLYRLMCLRDPQAYYRLARGSVIGFAFINNTLTLSSSVGYQSMQNLLQESEWFMARGKVTGTKNLEYTPNKLIRFVVGSGAGHVLGVNIFSALLDEVNFAKGQSVNIEQSKIMTTYTQVLERMGSRFMVNGRIAGKLFIVSSATNEYSFIESYIKKKADDPTVYALSPNLWQVKPSGTYSGKTFKVAIGGSNMPSRIVGETEDIDYVIRQGFQVKDVPIEFKGRFEMDLDKAIMNIMGIPISHTTRFITYDRLAKCYNDSFVNPFANEIISLGLDDPMSISDFFYPELVPYEIYSKPIFIHFDMSVTGDRTGIGATAVMGYKYQSEYDIKSGKIMPTKKLAFHHVFTVGIQCPNGSEISMQKNLDFVFYLKNTLGWNIKGVSTDGFQSVSLRQTLTTSGFDTSLVSLDRKPDGYLAFKEAINEKRISMIEISALEREIVQLQRDNATGKIDHLPQESKDMSDGLAGSLYNAILHEKDLELDVIEHTVAMMEANVENSSMDDRQTLLDNLMTVSRPDPIDMNIIDTTSEKPRQVLDMIKQANPNISLSDAVKAYINDVKDGKESIGIGSTKPERELTYEDELKQRYQEMLDMKDGFLL